MAMFNNTYQGKKVLITGVTGFKGSWLAAWLNRLGAHVYGLANGVPTIPSNFSECGVDSFCQYHEVDVRDREDLEKVLVEIEPDYIFHLAAQALVKESYRDPIATFTSNAFGTINLLDVLRSWERDLVLVLITSDKVYENVEWEWGYRENDRIGGKDPYSASKGMAELAIHCYINSFFIGQNDSVQIGIGRAGNVIGGGDWAADRIVPDCMKAWSQDISVDIRSPDSTRPWQHVLEPLSGYLVLGEHLTLKDIENYRAYNFGPHASQNGTVRELIEEMIVYWDKVSWRDVSEGVRNVHEAGLLKLNCDRALKELAWMPTLDFRATVDLTVEWYKNFYGANKPNMLSFTLGQIEEYEKTATSLGRKWAV